MSLIYWILWLKNGDGVSCLSIWILERRSDAGTEKIAILKPNSQFGLRWIFIALIHSHSQVSKLQKTYSRRNLLVATNVHCGRIAEIMTDVPYIFRYTSIHSGGAAKLVHRFRQRIVKTEVAFAIKFWVSDFTTCKCFNGITWTNYRWIPNECRFKVWFPNQHLNSLAVGDPWRTKRPLKVSWPNKGIELRAIYSYNINTYILHTVLLL